MMWSKGYAAEETKAAFARARELTAGTENPAERFIAYFAHWASSQTRGEFDVGAGNRRDLSARSRERRPGD